MSRPELEGLLQELGKEENLKALTELIDRLPAITEAVKLLDELVQTGALNTLTQLACMVASISNMLSDEMISGASSLTSSTLDLLAKTKSPIVKSLVSAVADHPTELAQEIEKTEVTGILSLLRVLRDQEVWEGLRILLAILKVLGRHGRIWQ